MFLAPIFDLSDEIKIIKFLSQAKMVHPSGNEFDTQRIQDRSTSNQATPVKISEFKKS